jgi:uncharacterized GH25 family protein
MRFVVLPPLAGGGRVGSCRSGIVAVALALAPSLAAAHELWLERGGSGFLLRYGHPGEQLAIDASRVKAVRCLERGAVRDLAARTPPAQREIVFPGSCEAVSAFLDGGTWSLTPDGEVNRPRTEVPQAVRSWVSRQFAKWVDVRSQAGCAAVLGDELELVPPGDLSRARQGDKITLRVLSRGKPVRDAVVSVDHKPVGESDSKGEVRVRLRSSGLEVFGATLRRKVATPEADEVVLEASLSFEVAR